MAGRSSFDLLRLDRRDLRRLLLLERKALLKEIIPPRSQALYLDHVEEQGTALFDLSASMTLRGSWRSTRGAGTTSRRPGSRSAIRSTPRYRGGRRSSRGGGESERYPGAALSLGARAATPDQSGKVDASLAKMNRLL